MTLATTPPDAALAEQMNAVKAFEVSNGRQYDPRLKRLEAKAPLGLNEGVHSQGGFLLDPTVSAEFLTPIHEEGVFSRLVRRLPVGANSNYGWLNGIGIANLRTSSTPGAPSISTTWVGSIRSDCPPIRPPLSLRSVWLLLI
jgi:hypothetical protein